MDPRWVDGVVREFDDEHGVGVLDSPETPGGCWVHFTMIQRPPGLRLTLEAGRSVTFTFEEMPMPPGQDGYAYRAIEVRTIETGF